MTQIEYLKAEIAKLRNELRVRPIHYSRGGASAEVQTVVPYLQVRVRGGNRVLVSGADVVYGVLRKAGEAKPSAWIYTPKQATGVAAVGTVAPNIGKVTGITVTDRGQGYTVAPTVTIAPPISGTTATATCTIVTGGRVLAVNITACGSGYHDGTTTATFTAAPGGGTTATGTPVLRGGKVVGVTITNPGKGYVTPPTCTITDTDPTPGTGFAGTSIMSSGEVDTVTITNPGSGYTAASPPVVTFAPPPSDTPLPVPCNPADDTPSPYADGVGFGSVVRGSLNGADFSRTPLALICHDDRSLLPYGLMGDGPVSIPFSRAPDDIISWYETFMRLTTTDPNADGILPAWVPMGGGA